MYWSYGVTYVLGSCLTGGVNWLGGGTGFDGGTTSLALFERRAITSATPPPISNNPTIMPMIIGILLLDWTWTTGAGEGVAFSFVSPGRLSSKVGTGVGSLGMVGATVGRAVATGVADGEAVEVALTVGEGVAGTFVASSDPPIGGTVESTGSSAPAKTESDSPVSAEYLGNWIAKMPSKNIATTKRLM